MKEFISKPGDLLEDIWSDKDVNIVQKTYHLGKRKFDLIDIRMNSSGQDEEQKYIRSGFYRQNIRIGNTIIENSKDKYCQFASKGLPKIFHIKLEHIQYFQKKINLDKIQRNVAQIIFENVNKAFHFGKRVELIKTQKINGQNAQISYNYEYDSWVICSKHASLLASCLEDLHIYKQQRFHFTLLIAEHWLKQVKKFSKQQLGELKKLLDGRTAVGQFCGHPDNQQIIQYSQPNIIWFAIVDNYTQEFALDPIKSKKQLQKFNFTFARTKSIVLTSSHDNFYSTLQKLYMKVAQASIQNSEFGIKGSVVYFVVAETEKNGVGRQKTIGGGSLNTMQYALIQKIREKVSKNIGKKQQKSEVLNKYKQQILKLQKSSSSRPPFPYQYYFKILSAFLELSQTLLFSDKDLRKNFTAYLKLVFYCLFKRISIAKFGPTMIEDEAFMSKVKEIPFYKYGGLGCKTRLIYIVVGLPGMFKTYLGQKISNHFQKINVPFSIISIENMMRMQEYLDPLNVAQQSPLQHYYLDGCFDSQSIFKIVRYIHEKRDSNSYYKFILIKDQIKNKFKCKDENQYPFSLQTIVMCYYGQHQNKINSARLQQKIDNLKLVTQKLQSNGKMYVISANFNEAIGKLNLQEYSYPFSRQCKLKNSEQFSKIILDILEGKDEKKQFNLYGILILRLEQCDGIQYMSEDLINTEIEHLIKASYPSIPIINFKK